MVLVVCLGGFVGLPLFFEIQACTLQALKMTPFFSRMLVVVPVCGD